MRFIFLAHWEAERYATTERLAHALASRGHDVLHLVLPRRNPLSSSGYNRRPHPFPSRVLWSPLARMGPLGRLDAALGSRVITRWLRTHPEGDLTIVLQSAWFLPLAERIRARFRVYAAIDVVAEVDPTDCVSWATHVFCLARFQERSLTARFPGAIVKNLGQSGRPPDQFSGPRDDHPTIAYVGGAHAYLRRDLLVELAALPASLLLIGCNSRDAIALFGRTAPGNVTAAGWLTGAAFAREVSRAWVGVIPYDHEHPRVIQSSPDKPYDYFMAGMPVVSTPIPELLGIEGVTIASPPEFSRTVERALASYDPSVEALQRANGAAYSPERFAERFLAWLRE